MVFLYIGALDQKIQLLSTPTGRKHEQPEDGSLNKR